MHACEIFKKWRFVNRYEVTTSTSVVEQNHTRHLIRYFVIEIYKNVRI